MDFSMLGAALVPVPIFAVLFFFYRQETIFKIIKLKDRIAQLEIELEGAAAKLEGSKKDKVDSYEVQELLHDLTAGKALIEIRRVAPSSFFLRSPKDSL